MEEQLISYETAVLAQEKGFNVAVKYYYTDKTTLDCAYGNIKTYNALSAPTQALLQKWLREEHGVNMFIDVSGIKGKYIAFIKNWIYEGEDVKAFDSYELALEAALQEALKLIKS